MSDRYDIATWLREKSQAELKSWKSGGAGCLEYADAWAMAADAIRRGDYKPSKSHEADRAFKEAGL